MSDLTSSFPFGADVSGEGLDYSAIFGGTSADGDVNPFDTLVAQETKTAAPAGQPQIVPDAAPAAPTPEAPVQAAPEAQTAEVPVPAVPEAQTSEAPIHLTAPAKAPEKAPDPPPAEEENLIGAAIARQEEAAAQKTAKSLFEKAPVFSYGSAREEVADSAQTFEELRIAKADDFPELSEGKRVSWSVEYGKVTKQISDPKGTTIRSVKEEIERSKAFLDGLKKAKDKNPDCLVKPRVTAQSKGIAGYKGVFQSLEEARESEKTICLIPSGDGKVYEMRKTELGEFVAPKDKVIDIQQIRAGFTPALPLIPQELLQQIISFFRCYMGGSQEFEALAHILWDKENEEFVVRIPQQEVSKARIDADLSGDAMPEKRYLHYADIHSHNSMEAKFSPPG